MLVLPGGRPKVTYPQPPPGQLVLRRRHLAVTNDEDLLQRQQCGQLGVLAERLELRHIVRAIPSSTTQGVKPHWHPTITSGQRKQFELLYPLPLGVVAWLQVRNRILPRLLREQPSKLDRHRIGVQAAQVDSVFPCGSG